MSHLADKAVLVTGAAGCIGAWVVKLLRDVGAVPVAYDLVDNRERLHLIMDGSDDVAWELGDITDFDRLMHVAERHAVSAIIHLAALQVPFCKADPIGSTRINVMGSINILELARQRGIDCVSYASSIAAPAMTDSDALSTLYGAHKVCGEQMAAVYWQDWGVPSIGIRPAIIYGPGRDQGMSAAPTIAMLAAAAGEPYSNPFSGDVAFVHAEDAAARFIAAVVKSYNCAYVFDMNGTPESVNQVIERIKQMVPEADLRISGEPMPFPAVSDNGALDALLDVAPYRSMSAGIASTLAVFERAKARGVDLRALFLKTLEKNQ